jgi:EmrB/QacA subfamily drug resistance transporter
MSDTDQSSASTDGGVSTTIVAAAPRRNTWIIPLIVGSALFVQTLNANSITTALPAMAVTYGVDPVNLNIAITTYLLGMAVSLPLSGWIADRFGARTVFLWAMTLFGLVSALCGLAPSVEILLVLRCLQGAVAALLGPVGRLVLLRNTPKSEIVGSMALFTIPALLGPLLGPVLGGAIVTFVSWHWVFIINLPIAAISLLLVKRFVPVVKPEDVAPLDWRGILLIGIALAALVFGLSILGRSDLPLVAFSLLFVAVFFFGFYFLHARRTPAPVIDLAMFRISTFRAAVLGFGFQSVIPSSMPYLLAMLLQVCMGMDAFSAGLVAFTAAIGSLAMRPTAPRILRRFGFRDTLVATCILSAAFTAACGLFRPDTPVWIMVAILMSGGFFRSLQATSTGGMTYADLESGKMSAGATTSALVQQIGQSVGICLSALLLQAFQAVRGDQGLTWQAVAPVFVVMGSINLLAQFFYLRLPKNAGDDMNGRSA